MKLNVDKNVCISCGTCISLCPDVFEFDNNQKSDVKKGADLAKNEKCIKEAINACPVQAISQE